MVSEEHSFAQTGILHDVVDLNGHADDVHAVVVLVVVEYVFLHPFLRGVLGRKGVEFLEDAHR